MKRKKVLRITLWSASVLFVLLMVLGIHIYLVTGNKSNYGNPRQLSRIDFKEPVNPAEADKIRSYVSHLEGVQGTYFNMANGILVYAFDPGRQSSLNVFNGLIHYGHYKAERYTVDESTAQTGCPAMLDK